MPMATEKLADGIRKFAADLNKLKEFVGQVAQAAGERLSRLCGRSPLDKPIRERGVARSLKWAQSRLIEAGHVMHHNQQRTGSNPCDAAFGMAHSVRSAHASRFLMAQPAGRPARDGSQGERDRQPGGTDDGVRRRQG